jgi:uncharacterized protein (DUF1501 family)
MISRRNLLKASAVTAAGALAGVRLYAAPAASPRFLLVFLRGGYDCANVLVPYASDFYYQVRPNLAIARPDPARDSSALALDGHWALTPVLRPTLGTLYAARQVAFIPFAGTDDLSRSHFETQDNIELGQGAPKNRDYGSGFLGRLSSVLTGVPPIAFTDALPVAFRGKSGVPNISLRGVGKAPFDTRQASDLTSMYEGHHLQTAIQDGLQLRETVAEEFAEEMTAANRGAVTTRGFQMEAGRIARLLRDQYRLGFVDIGGWDTHVNEGAAQGALANNLDNLGRGLAALAEGMGSDWANTVVVVVSEFGRTFRENGNRGTDHGHGSVYWVLGGSIAGGQVAGRQVRVERATLFQDRDYPVLNNYRDWLGGLFRRLWTLSPTQLERVFPGAEPIDYRLI